jgi:hypothetical protein
MECGSHDDMATKHKAVAMRRPECVKAVAER